MSLEPGGRPGGEIKFIIGVLLAGVGFWLFFDSVRLTTGHHGLMSNIFGGRDGGAMGETTSMAIILVPLFIGVIGLFFDVSQKWAWALTIIGVSILSVEILSRMRPHFNVKATHAVLMLVMIAGGLGLMLRAYIEDNRAKIKDESET
jgi:hypothetical protein